MSNEIFNINPMAIKAIIKEALEEVFSEKPNLNSDLPDVPQVMDVKDAARFLSKSVPTLYGMTSKREIPHYKRGKRLYFRRAELEEWIMEGRCKTQKEIDEDAIQIMKRKKGGLGR